MADEAASTAGSKSKKRPANQLVKGAKKEVELDEQDLNKVTGGSGAGAGKIKFNLG